MSRCASVISCPYCNWKAKLVDDTVAEVIEGLGRLLLLHQAAEHSGKETQKK